MKVILQEKVANLGDVGDQVNVKAGYARNYLLTTGKATRATTENIADFETRRVELEAKAAETLTQAQARAEKLTDFSVKIAAEASDEGKLFGSVGPREVADAITEAGFELIKSEVHMPEGPIRNTGEFDVEVQLHSEVKTTVKVNVEAS